MPHASFTGRSIGDNGDGATTATVAHTIPAGTNRVILLAAHTGGVSAAAPTGVTFDGEPMTKIADAIDEGNNAVSLWRRLLGDGGAITADAVATYASAASVVVVAVGAAGVDQTTPVRDFDTFAPATIQSSFSLTVGSALGDLILDALTSRTILATWITDTEGQIERWNVEHVVDTTQNQIDAHGSTKAGAAMETAMAWDNLGASRRISYIVVSLATAGDEHRGGGMNRKRRLIRRGVR